MRILHLSDFHLDKETRDDSVNHIVTPMLNSIEQYQKEKPFNIILFAGDLINLGGSSYENIDFAFNDFEELFIKPIVAKTSLPKDNFFFVPGNHDINRKADSKNLETGLRKNLSTMEAVNQHFKQPEGNERIKAFKKFEQEFYSDAKIDKLFTEFHSAFKINVGDKKIGIACLNSSWRCFDSKTDKQNILIGETQILKTTDYLQDCNIRVAISHHHFDWLSVFDSEVIASLLKQHFHLYLCGHVHKVSAGYCEDPDGQLFSFCAPGILSSSIRKSEVKHENGFTIIDYMFDEAKLKAIFIKGAYPKNVFVLNTSIGKEGIWETTIPMGEQVEKIFREQKLIRQIKLDNLPKINSHLLTHSTDTKAPKSLDEIFVMPNIVIKNEFDAEKDDEIIADIKDLILADKNYIVFGTKESGKTILLDKILLETLNYNKSCHFIPVYVDFNKIKTDVTTNIRDFWGKSVEETKEHLTENKVLLLIDNISFDEEDIHTLKHLKRFFEEHKNIKFIGTYLQFFEDDFPLNLELVSLLSFDKVTIKQFKSKQIKLLIKKWFPDSDRYDTPKKT